MDVPVKFWTPGDFISFTGSEQNAATTRVTRKRQKGIGKNDAAPRFMKDALFNGFTGMAQILLIEDAYQKGDKITWGTLVALDMGRENIRDPDFPLLRLLPQFEAIVFAQEQDKDREIARSWMIAKDLAGPVPRGWR